MSQMTLAVIAGAWMAEAFALGYVMGRRGFDAYVWTTLGTLLGPIAIALAIGNSRSGRREPILLRQGRRHEGTLDILVGTDGSPESLAAIDRVAALFGVVARRVTIARVVPVDAADIVEREARSQLTAAHAAHPELDASVVLLRGAPVDALRDYARRLRYDLIAVGTRGGGKTRKLLGGVASTLAHGGDVPVLLVDEAPVPSDMGKA